MSTNNTIVDFSGQGLKLDNASDAQKIADSISNESSNLVTINLEGNTLGIEAAELIGQSLEKASKLRFALLKDLFTGRLKTEIPDALKHLTNGILKANAKLEELDLSDNAFGPIGMKALVDFLGSESCSELKVLKLNNNGLGVQGSTLLSTVVDKLTKLEVLICGRNRLENEGSIAMSKSLQKLSNLTRLEMFQNGIRFEGMKEISLALQSNKNLVELNLNDNTMTDEGAKLIADGLKFLSKLKVANFGDCLTRTKGFKSILDALIESKALNSTLTELILNGNEIKGADAGQYFIQIVSKLSDRSLKIDLSSNCFGERTVNRIQEELNGKINLVLDDDEGDEDEKDSDVEEKVNKLIRSPDTTLDDLCSQIINLSIESFDQSEQKVPEKILKQSEELLAATSTKTTSSFNVASSLLVHMGLLKREEDGKYKQINDLRGPFLTLKNLSPKLDRTQKDVLQTFIGNKPNKLVDETGKFKTQLMQSLFI